MTNIVVYASRKEDDDSYIALYNDICTSRQKLESDGIILSKASWKRAKVLF